MGERQAANNAGRGSDRVTISEAAALLSVHPNTVRNRVRAGIYNAEKVLTENGPTWMIDRDSLSANAPTSDSQQLVGRVPREVLTSLVREVVREAGLAQDPDLQIKLERAKARLDLVRGQAVLGAAFLPAMAAFAAFLENPVRQDALMFAVYADALSVGAAVVVFD